MAFSSLGDTLRKSIRAAGIEPQVLGAQTIEHFGKVSEEILGKAVAAKVSALYVKNKTLTVGVSSAVVGQELKLHEREILQKLNTDPAHPHIERLRFLV